MKIGILHIQGDIEEHFFMTKDAIGKLGIKGEVIEVKKSKEIKELSGLIIPGGESTTISRFIQRENLGKEIKNLADSSGAIMGTCAGAILLAKECDDQRINPLKLMDISVKRNAYGRQRESFATDLEIEGIGNFPGVFIRAPAIGRVGEKVEVMATHAGKPVMVCKGNLVALTFHPELTNDTRIHEYFLGLMGNESSKENRL